MSFQTISSINYGKIEDDTSFLQHFCSVKLFKMCSSRKIRHTMLTVFVILFELFGCYALERSGAHLPGKGLHNHSEIHEAKNLIDALSFKLQLNLQKYQTVYENLVSTKDEIKTLNKLKGLLNDLTKKSSICEKFYTNFDFIAARQIIIKSSASLPNDYTVSLQGIVAS